MHITPGAYQSQFARKVKAAVGEKLLVTSVGNIRTGEMAMELLEDSKDGEDGKEVNGTKGKGDALDAVFSGRWFQKNPGLVWSMAEELGVEINVASQIRWAFKGRGGGKK